MTDHLARLCLEGTGSSGRYTPHAFDLRLLGTEQAADHIVYLHEVHHGMLNDETAWGTALHVYARLPGADPRFARLLDACRTVHESLATFGSVQIATARHGELDAVLAAYPRYVPLYQTTDRLTGGAGGANRRQLIAAALAKLCMQTPILDTVADEGLEEFRIAAIREHDRPDARWYWFMRRGADLLTAAAQAADRVVATEYGPAVLDSDGLGSDLYTSTSRDHDVAWDRWEAVAYEHLGAALATTGADIMSINGHRAGTARLLELIQHRYGDLGLRAEMTDEQRRHDASLAASVLQQVRHNLAGDEPHRAVVMPSTTADDVVRMIGDRPVGDGHPAMIVDGRPAERLAALYRWSPGSDAPPPMAVRLMIEDESGLAVGHAPLADPADLTALTERWGDRGAFVVCAGASCLADPKFADRWLTNAPRPIFLLVDIEPDRFVPRWAADGRTVVAVPLHAGDAGGHREALLFTMDDGRVWWLVVADDITVNLMITYLWAHLGESLRVDPAALGAHRETALLTVAHVLATESFISFDALGGTHAD
jgi:hypothetical protein